MCRWLGIRTRLLTLYIPLSAHTHTHIHMHAHAPIENVVKNVLESNHAFLRDNLTIDSQVAARLFGWKPQLLTDPPYHEICHLNECGKHYDAFDKWYMFAISSYTEDSLKVFCECLREIAEKDAKSKLVEVAEEILKKLEGDFCCCILIFI